MQKNEFVSVIITTYKRPVGILSRAVESVLTQTWTDLELILVNDWPEDRELAAGIRHMVEDLGDERVRLIEHERNLGSNAARNTGISAADGTYIGFLDDDDTWAPDKLARQLEAFAAHPDAALVYGGYQVVQNGRTSFNRIPRSGVLPFSMLLERNVVGPTSFPLIRTSVLKELGSFDPEQKCCQDYELWLRIAKSYPLVGIEDCMGTRYIYNDSVFRTLKSFHTADRRILSKYRDCFRAYPREHNRHLLGKFLYMLRNREYKIAFRYKLDAWRADPTNPENLLPVLLASKLRAKYASRRR